MAIIGFAGRIGSGKDHCAKIVQYLEYENDLGIKSMRLHPNPIGLYSLDDFLQGRVKDNIINTWQIKKFAYKLKQIASILTGIPVEDFEKQEVKDSLLGDEWRIYPLFYSTQWDNLNLIFTSEKEREDYIDSCTDSMDCRIEESYIPTVRKFLQLLGTEAIRNNIHPNTWVNALMSEYKGKFHNHTEEATASDGGYYNKYVTDEVYPNWLISDVRFPNEAKAIKDRGGIVIRVIKEGSEFKETEIEVNQYSNPERYSKPQKVIGTSKVTLKDHPSETALDNYNFDYVISAKQGDIQSLIDQVKEILIKEKIL
jgi:hypothetical protein